MELLPARLQLQLRLTLQQKEDARRHGDGGQNVRAESRGQACCCLPTLSNTIAVPFAPAFVVDAVVAANIDGSQILYILSIYLCRLGHVERLVVYFSGELCKQRGKRRELRMMDIVQTTNVDIIK